MENILIPLNASSRQSVLVEKAHTAEQIGSGSLDVLATPMLIALMEAAALEAVQKFLPAAFTTVGTRVDIEHLRATPVGESVTAEAVLVKREGRVLEFTIEARDRLGVIGQGRHSRVIIEINKFLSRLRRD